MSGPNVKIICRTFSIFISVQFNKMSHNCAGWSVLGVVAEEEDLVMDYINEMDLDEFDHGYNIRSDR